VSISHAAINGQFTGVKELYLGTETLNDSGGFFRHQAAVGSIAQ
jgi:hypothetical protein